MRNLKIVTIILMIFFINIAVSLNVVAQKNEEDLPKAIGIGLSMIGGYGLSYRHFISPEVALQYTGDISGSTDDYIDYNFGIMYQKILHQGNRTRLFLSPGICWAQTLDMNENDDITYYTVYSKDKENEEIKYYVDNNDSRGVATGVDIGMEWQYEKISINFFVGLGVYWSQNHYSSDARYQSKEEALAQEMKSGVEFATTGGGFLLYYF